MLKRKNIYLIFIAVFFAITFVHILLLMLGRSWIGTTISIYLTVIFILISIAKSKRFKHKKRVYGNVLLVLISVIIALFLGEVILRLGTSKYHTYSEKNYKGIYISPFCNKFLKLKQKYYYSQDNYELRLFPPNYSYHLNTSVFSIKHQYNELGIRERNNILELAENKTVIFALGDSFTEGVGASGENTWLRHFEDLINSDSSSNYFTINCGLSGLDPIYSFVILEHISSFIKPDYVILSIGTNDIYDIMYRGGFERFVNGIVEYKSVPIKSYFYAFSYIYRSIAHVIYDYPSFFMNQEKFQSELILASNILYDAIEKYYKFSKENDAKLLIQFFPDHKEANSGNYLYKEFTEIVLSTKNNDDLWVLDLLESFNNLGIDSTKADKLYWQTDGHFNKKGNRIWSEILYKAFMDYRRGINALLSCDSINTTIIIQQQ